MTLITISQEEITSSERGGRKGRKEEKEEGVKQKPPHLLRQEVKIET